MDFMEGAGDSFVESGGGGQSIAPEAMGVVGFAGGSVMGGSRGTPSITPEDIDVVGFAGGSIGGGAGATKIISNEDMGVRGFADVGSMMPHPEIEMISALGQIAAKGQYGELLNAVKDMPANIAGVTDAINNGDMRSLGSTVANAVFAAAGAKAKTGMAQGALAAAKNIISPKAIEATAAAQARMPSMAMSLGAAPTANVSAADKAKAALEASKRSAAQPITLGAVAGCGAAAGAAQKAKGPGHVFASPDEAASDLLLHAAELSRSDPTTNIRERGGCIYPVEGGYTYDEPVVGKPGEVPIRVRRDAVGWAHTHPLDNPLNPFAESNDAANVKLSKRDVKQAALVNGALGRQIPAYLGGSDGAVRRFDPGAYKGKGVELRGKGYLKYR